jgi:hypothetical protein
LVYRQLNVRDQAAKNLLTMFVQSNGLQKTTCQRNQLERCAEVTILSTNNMLQPPQPQPQPPLPLHPLTLILLLHLSQLQAPPPLLPIINHRLPLLLSSRLLPPPPLPLLLK